MAIITDEVMDRLRAKKAEVFFVSGSATKWWNARRNTDPKRREIALLGGYYWTMNGEEAGPFRTPSAAYRDVYYRRLLREEPPLMTQDDLVNVEAALKKEAEEKAPPKRRRPKLRLVKPTRVELRRRAG